MNVTLEFADPGPAPGLVPDIECVKAAIKAAMRASGRTQAALAAECGFSPKHVCQVLSGRVPGTFRALELMAHACGLRIAAVAVPDSEGGGS